MLRALKKAKYMYDSYKQGADSRDRLSNIQRTFLIHIGLEKLMKNL